MTAEERKDARRLAAAGPKPPELLAVLESEADAPLHTAVAHRESSSAERLSVSVQGLSWSSLASRLSAFLPRRCRAHVATHLVTGQSRSRQ